MPLACKEAAPGRLEIREGGGFLAVFGLPFLAVGIYASLTSLGLATMRSNGQPATQATALTFAIVFGLVGALLVFGRIVTAVDLTQRVIIKQWRVLLPLHTRTYQASDYTAVTLGFLRGDSDSADRYPVGLAGGAAPPLTLCSPTRYPEARDFAAAVARHLGFDIEDSSTDHPARLSPSETLAPLRERLRSATWTEMPVTPPPLMRSHVSDEGGGVRVVIPLPPMHPVAAIGGLFPSVFAMSMLSWLGLFSRSRTLTPAEWIFIGVLFVGFGVLPAAGVLSGWLRSRVGKTIVTVSPRGLGVVQRGILRTRTVAAVDAADILDVDYSTKESVMAAARRHADEQSATMRGSPRASSAPSATVERVFAVMGRFVKGHGVIVKTRKGLTTFGEGLADDEIQYLHAIARRALAGRAG